jgi:hypothetical protein
MRVSAAAPPPRARLLRVAAPEAAAARARFPRAW